MHHLALDVERWWFSAIMANRADARAYFEVNPNGAWSVPHDTDVAALYASECAASDIVISASSLDVPPPAWPEFLGQPRTNAEIIVHVIAETATHAGHLDIVREMIDGHRHLILD